MTDTGADPATDEPGFTLCVYRHTDDVATMERFLRALGLHRTVFRDQDGCTFMWGRSGMIALFDASSGDTPATAGGAQLCFETNDRDLAVSRFKAAGVTAVAWDEPPTPAAGVRDPQGAGIWIAQAYHDADDEGDDYDRHPIDVVAVRHSKDTTADADFFALMDFRRRETTAEAVTLEGAGNAGLIRLQPGEVAAATPTETGSLGAPVLVELAFESDQLDTAANRLRAAGFPVADLGEPGGAAISVVDPDGVRVEIRRR